MGRLGALQRDSPPVSPHQAVELGGGGKARQLDQLRLDLGLGDPGDRPYLGVAQAPPRRTPRGQGGGLRAPAQLARAPSPSAGPSRSARNPGAAGVKAKRLMSLPAVELLDQLQPAAGGGGDVGASSPISRSIHSLGAVASSSAAHFRSPLAFVPASTNMCSIVGRARTEDCRVPSPRRPRIPQIADGPRRFRGSGRTSSSPKSCNAY